MLFRSVSQSRYGDDECLVRVAYEDFVNFLTKDDFSMREDFNTVVKSVLNSITDTVTEDVISSAYNTGFVAGMNEASAHLNRVAKKVSKIGLQDECYCDECCGECECDYDFEEDDVEYD